MALNRQLPLSDRLQTLSADKLNFHPPTGISVLVVGAGVGGLMSALECRRKGHQVRVVERSSAPSTQGIEVSKLSVPGLCLIVTGNRRFLLHWYKYHSPLLQLLA